MANSPSPPPDARGSGAIPPEAFPSGRHALDAVRADLKEDFDVLRVLGHGSVATVYLARDRVLGVLVAIKVLNADRARDETARRRFEREARAAASLAEHPNVVAVQRFGRLPDQTPYLVMQFVKGRTMEERLEAEGRLSVAEARQVLRDVASALAVAHANGFLHRDVRPGNVLWDETHGRAVLTDFGIAAVLAAGTEESTRLTRTGQLMGELRYLSPEQLQDADLTELADIYLLGVLGYELLCAEGPYEARSNTDWITAHLRQQPRDLRTLRPDVDAATADLLKRCLAKDPMHRPRAADVVRALEGGAAGGGAGGPTAGTDLAELVKRRVPQAVLVAVGAGITLIGLADALEDLLPPESMLLTVVLAVTGVVASAVLAWFHGERGRQRAPLVEYLLLGLIGAAWLIVSVWVVVAR
jgi:serine/threonine-protein kinase